MERHKSHKKKVNLPPPQLEFPTMTLKDIKEALQDRIDKIEEEFKDGFDLIEEHPRSVTFFGSARFDENHPDYKKARSLAYKISNELNYTVATGGGPGIMEAGNRGAFEASGKSIGLTIELPHEQVTNPYLTDHVNFYYFFSRKVCMSFAAEAYIFFPGGFGTMDEFFEIITLVQNHKIQPVPIILVGNEYWNSMDKFIKESLLKNNTISEEDLSLYTITEDEEKIIEIIKNAPVRQIK